MQCWTNPQRELPEGEWLNEPDKIHWQEFGLECLMVRNQFGVWCGYVGVSPTHPCYGVEYSELDFEVHGGLTFSGFCREHEIEAISICHPGGEKVWWVGFDCAHASDLTPKFREILSTYNLIIEGLITTGFYRNQSYVINEVKHLAQQVAEYE